MQKEQKQRLNPVNSLYRISRLVSDTEDPLKALEIIIDEVVAALNPASASISLFNPDTRQLEIEVSRGLPKDSSKFALEPGRGVTGWVLATLFLTTLTLVRLPIVWSPSLMAPMRRMSRRIEA